MGELAKKIFADAMSLPDAERAELIRELIESVDGAADPSAEQAWIDENVPQCGYCQSGMLMSCAGALIAGHKGKEIMGEIDNVCICGTYQRVKTAVGSL